MPGAVDLRALRTLFGFRVPSDAVDFLESKGFDDSVWNWFDIQADAHARSFTVAKAMRLDVLQTIRDGLLDARREGFGERDFVKRLTPELQRLGWWGKQIIVGPDGGAEVAQLGSPARLKLIYRANTMSAYQAARFRQQLSDVANRPFWQYLAIMDLVTRPSHAALHTRVWRWDDPFWRDFYPPNGWNCRCRVRPLTETEVLRRGLTVEPFGGGIEEIEQEAGLNKRTGEVVMFRGVRWRGTDPVTGETRSMSPDPGWAGNPGLVPWQPNLDRYDEDIGRWYIRQVFRGPAFARTLGRVVEGVRAAGAVATRITLAPQLLRGERYPTALLTAADRDALGLASRTVLATDDLVLDNALSGGLTSVADFERAQRAIEQATILIRSAGVSPAIALRREGEVWLEAAIDGAPAATALRRWQRIDRDTARRLVEAAAAAGRLVRGSVSEI